MVEQHADATKYAPPNRASNRRKRGPYSSRSSKQAFFPPAVMQRVAYECRRPSDTPVVQKKGALIFVAIWFQAMAGRHLSPVSIKPVLPTRQRADDEHKAWSASQDVRRHADNGSDLMFVGRHTLSGRVPALIKTRLLHVSHKDAIQRCGMQFSDK